MRVPAELEPLLDMGVIDDVYRPLQAGKEAQVFLVGVRGEQRVAKVYKDASTRSFKHRADYTEGRRGRNSRRERAKSRRSSYGKAEIEAAWRAAEVDAIHRLRSAGVRVPEPYDFVEGVLVMELIQGADGEPAPRLVDVDLEEAEAKRLYFQLLREVTKMLCAGLVHGDLSDFNVLLAPDGPVIIDFPQAIDAAANRNARRILIRDVDNLTSFFARWVPNLRRKPYGVELWELYERAELTPDTRLTGRVQRPKGEANVSSIVDEIAAAAREETKRRAALGLPPVRARAPKPSRPAPPPKPIAPPPGASAPGRAEDSPAPKKRRRRRSKRRPEEGAEREPSAPKGRSGRDGQGPDDPFGDLDALLIADD